MQCWIVFLVVDGTSINKIDQLTDIEEEIMTNLFESAFEYLQEAWETVIEIEPEL